MMIFQNPLAFSNNVCYNNSSEALFRCFCLFLCSPKHPKQVEERVVDKVNHPSPFIPKVEYIYSSSPLRFTSVESMPNGCIVITGLPPYDRQVPTGEFSEDGSSVMVHRGISSSKICRLLHEYKNLLTEGDTGGKREYSRKRTHRLPLQNPSLRLPIVYTICDKITEDGTINVIINIFCNTVDHAYIVENGVIRTLTKKQVGDLIHNYSWACSKDLEVYLQECINSTPEGEIPDFYKFPTPPQ